MRPTVPIAAHCSLAPAPGQRIVRGRVREVGQSLVVVHEGGVNAFKQGVRGDIRPGDIVELAVDEGQVVCAARVLVRPPDASSWDEGASHKVREVLRARALMINLVRRFFLDRGFFEVPTPTLVPSPGMEPHLRGFATTFEDDAGGRLERWLPTSPEFALKRALCMGLEKIFEVKTVFRNGEMGPLHSPEFTMLEWYRAFEDYRAIMRDAEELVRVVAQGLRGYAAPFRGLSIDWQGPFERMTVEEAFTRYAEIDLRACLHDLEAFRQACAPVLSHVEDGEDFDSLFHRVMLELVEPRLGVGLDGVASPVILHDYPMACAALAVENPRNRGFCERFELYVAGVELANAFTEVNDPREMALRVRAARARQRRLGYTQTPPDGDLLRAMRRGMPPSGGIALGLDRLLMALLGLSHIAEALPFVPHDARSLSQSCGTLG